MNHTASSLTQEAVWLEAVSGNRIDLEQPDPASIRLDDIATGLSRIPLYLGQTLQKEPYPVAMRGIWVAKYLCATQGDTDLALLGILTDAHKAYIGECSAPLRRVPWIKQQLESIEHRLQAAILTALNAPALTINSSQLIDHAKNQARTIEAQHLMPSQGHDWNMEGSTDAAQTLGFIEPVHGDILKYSFIQCVEWLQQGRALS